MKRFFSCAVLLMLSMFAVAGHAQAKDAKQQAAEGKQIFLQKCMMCHSVNKDQVMVGPSLWSELDKSPHKKTAAQARSIIMNGKGKMPTWKNVLTPEQINDILAYFHTLK